MNSIIIPKPVRRGPLRKFLGKKAYTLKRFLNWYISGKKFASKKESSVQKFLLIEHRSLLLRPLKNVDMVLQYNKIDNLKQAIRPINHLLIEPGETFSFWYLVGNPSARRGFKSGMTLENGRIKQGTGGGLCQLANLIYWMAIHTPLTITERWRHSFDVFPDVNRTIPFGCGATVSYNYIDLQITNTTKQKFQLNLWLTDKDLCGEIRSNEDCLFRYQIEETNHQIQSESWGGYSRHNQIIRKIFNKQSGEFIKEELLTENHAIMMYNPLLKENNPTT